MSFWLACKAFFKAWKNPEQGKKFLEEKLAIAKTPSEPVGEVTHLRLLSLLQQQGRLIDFFKEDIKGFSDAQIGAAVRKIHADCNKSLEELVTIRPIFQENEGSSIQIPKGYDSQAIKVVGKVQGEPPFTGILVHKGWKAHKRSLPKAVGESHLDIIFPAEVEVR